MNSKNNDNIISCATEYIWDVLKKVYDPEIGINVVDLGLIYSVDVEKNGDKFDISIAMTLTSPGCPLADVIANDVKIAVEETLECASTQVLFVFDPPWNMDMITEEGKMHLGLL